MGSSESSLRWHMAAAGRCPNALIAEAMNDALNKEKTDARMRNGELTGNRETDFIPMTYVVNGLRWKIFYRKQKGKDDKELVLSLCDEMENEEWSVEATVKIRTKQINEQKEKEKICKTISREHVFSKASNELAISLESVNDLNVQECVKIFTKSANVDLIYNFSPSNLSADRVLLIGDQKFYVQSAVLSMFSRFFEVLFTGRFSESEKKEVTMEDVDANEFRAYANCIFCAYGDTMINAENVTYILKLADRFDTPRLVYQCSEFLKNNTSMKMIDRIKLAFEYQFNSVLTSVHHELLSGKAISFKNMLQSAEWNHLPRNCKLFVIRSMFDAWEIQNGMAKGWEKFWTNGVVGERDSELVSFTYVDCGLKWKVLYRKQKEKNQKEMVLMLSDECLKRGGTYSVKAVANVSSQRCGRFDFKREKNEEHVFSAVSPELVIPLDSFENTSPMFYKESSCYKEHIKVNAKVQLKFLYDFSTNNVANDRVLCVDKIRLNVPSKVLSTFSRGLRELFGGMKKEVLLDGVKISEVEDFLICILCEYGNTRITEKNVQKILRLAEKYDTPRVKHMCSEFLTQPNAMTLNKKLELAAKYQFGYVFKAMRPDINGFKPFGQLLSSIDWQQMPEDAVDFMAISMHEAWQDPLNRYKVYVDEYEYSDEDEESGDDFYGRYSDDD